MSTYTTKQACDIYEQAKETLAEKGYSVKIDNLTEDNFAELKNSNGQIRCFIEYIQFYDNSPNNLDNSIKFLTFDTLPNGFTHDKVLGMKSNIGKVTTMSQLANNSYANAITFYEWCQSLPIYTNTPSTNQNEGV